MPRASHTADFGVAVVAFVGHHFQLLHAQIFLGLAGHVGQLLHIGFFIGHVGGGDQFVLARPPRPAR